MKNTTQLLTLLANSFNSLSHSKFFQSLDLKNSSILGLNSFSCCKTPQSLNPWLEATFLAENPFNHLAYCNPLQSVKTKSPYLLQTPLIFGPQPHFLLQTLNYQYKDSKLPFLLQPLLIFGPKLHFLLQTLQAPLFLANPTALPLRII